MGFDGLKFRMLGAQAYGLALAAMLVGVAVDTAAAQGWTDLLSPGGRSSPPQTDGRAPAYADPGRNSSDPLDFFRSQGQRRSSMRYGNGGGGSTGYCVRLCDGRYFPVQRAGDVSPDALCSAFCPASKTKVYYGSNIDHARASDGKRYEDLDNAYEYRERVVPDCTCNGKDAFGLVPLDAASDPTLRPGDIVASKDGLMAYRTSYSRRGTETANFTPVERSDLARGRRGRGHPVEEN
jgi:Protein of unknown function (DUF2865)